MTSGAVENRPLTSIRGVASLWVVGHHWLPDASQHLRVLFDPGFAAVDLFFVLSGLILARVHADLSARGLPDFYLRRLFRLYPLHVVCLAWLVGMIAASHGWASVDWPTLAASAALLHPFLDIQPLANPPSWSIGVELGCYLAFPLLLDGLRRLTGRRAGGAPALAATTALALGLLWLEWRLQASLLGVTHGAAAMARGLCGFALGMAISAWGEAMLTRRRGIGLVSAALELAGLAGLAWSVHGYRWGAIPPCSAVLLAGLAFDRGPLARLLRLSPWLWLGRISFSIYLVHYPLLMLARTAIDPLQLGRAGQWLWYAGLLALLLGLSTLTWRLIEEPARRLPRRLRRRSVAATAAA